MKRFIGIPLLLFCFLAVITTVSYCKNHYKEQGKQELSKVLDNGRINILEQSASITSEAMTKRDEHYSTIHDAGKEAVKALSKAVPQGEGKNEVDADGVIPLAWSDALIVQHHRVCGGSSSCSAAGTDVQPQAAPQTTRP